jgi:ABC-type glycerol-3-phosphate transport system permease component
MKTLLIIIITTVILLYALSRFFPVWKKVSLYLVLILLACLILLPFYMMFVMSTLPTNGIFAFPPKMWFGTNFLANYKSIIAKINIYRAFFNSCFVSITHTVLVLFFCSIGGYAFAVHNFPFKKQLFNILLFTMMIPAIAGIIPWFIMMSKFGWINSYKALIIPGAANAFGIYWMRQYCSGNVSPSLLDAARIDGCSEWMIFFRVVAPIIVPAYASLGIMQFVGVWNDFMQPLMILRKPTIQTLPVMLKGLIDNRIPDYGALMLANTFAVTPLLIVFLAASRYFLSGLTAGALKE